MMRFCAFCGADLPPGEPRFCIECGQPVEQFALSEETVPAATGPTVRLANARTAQAVIGGTVKLPSSGATPPGLWFAPELPGPDDIVAVYAPLRAIVGGWSGLVEHGWKKCGQEWAAEGVNRTLVRFVVERTWFAAPGAAHNLRLIVQISAVAHADEGRTRRGFRYRIGADPPMDVAAAWWVDGSTPRFDLPVPQIQIMAPPRIGRVSDFPETVRRMNAREAEAWARQGEVHGLFRMPLNSTTAHPGRARHSAARSLTAGRMAAARRRSRAALPCADVSSARLRRDCLEASQTAHRSGSGGSWSRYEYRRDHRVVA
ncbi:MAG: zinc ribbon domain-containing protein [Roseiflexaceae bacterium]|nr:zinc ribbon domain-containing protein [Roseiflexaceae bacterium]